MNRKQFTWWYERVFLQSPSLCALKYDDEKMWEAWKAAKQWQGLSDEEVLELIKECKAPYHSHALEPRLFAKAIEQKLKEKNT